MRKVLFIAYNFPPVGGAGVQRPVKFVKYLADWGWEPLVVTVANPSVPVTDASLVKDIPATVRVWRAGSLEPSYRRKQQFTRDTSSGFGLKRSLRKLAGLLLLPDPQVLWWPQLVKTLMVLMHREKPACVFVTAPPFSAFVPAVLVGRLFRIPVVVDYRDEWHFSRSTLENAVRGRLATVLDTVLERLVIASTSAFTAANASYVHSLTRLYRQHAAGKGHVITNGYDEEDFLGDGAQGARVKDGKVKLLYAGTVWAATSFAPLAEALNLLFAQEPSYAKRMSLRVIGRVVDQERRHFESEALAEVATLSGYLDHAQAVAELQLADVLILTLSDLPGAERIITGKAFEYMASGKHILAIVPEGETSRLLRENYDNVSLVHPGEPHAVAACLGVILERIAQIRARRGNEVPQFSRRNLTGALAEVFNRVAT